MKKPWHAPKSRGLGELPSENHFPRPGDARRQIAPQEGAKNAHSIDFCGHRVLHE